MYYSKKWQNCVNYLNLEVWQSSVQWSGAAMADSVSLLRQSWFQGLVDVPAPRPLPLGLYRPQLPTPFVSQKIFYIHYSLPSLTGWSKWPYRAGTIYFFHFIGEIIKIQKGSADIPASTPISHYTIKAASKVLSEFEMKSSICMLPHVHLPRYKNVHWNNVFATVSRA